MADTAIDLVDCDLIEVAGAESAAYLQGQLSQDVESLDVGTSAMSFVLQPSGHVDAWLRVHRTGPTSFVLEVEPGYGSSLSARLRKFLIRTDATVSEPSLGRVLRIRGVAPGDGIPDERPAGLMVALVAWPELVGTDLVGPPGRIAQIADDLDADRVDAPESSTAEGRRIRAGVPRFGIDIAVGSIPASGGAAVIAASVNFTKGCYTGQELVARMNSRGGQAPIRLRRLASDRPLEVGATVLAGGSDVGVVTSSAGAVGLAGIMRKVEPGAGVLVAGVEAVVTALPGDPVTPPA